MALLNGDSLVYATANDPHDQPEDSALVQVETGDVGAPIERVSPLGRQVTLFTAVMLNVGRMIGSGIFAVPGPILNSVGSIGVALLYWLIAPLFASCGLALYSELAAMFPYRSGAEVVYLEQAYPRPRHFVSTVFAITAILTSLGIANAVVFAQYFLTALDLPITSASQTRVAVCILLVTFILVAVSTKWSLRIVDLLASLKVLALSFAVLTGLAVLLRLTRISDPYQGFRHPFEGTSLNPNALALALVKVNQSFAGWHNAFTVLGEIRGNEPVRTARKAGNIALALTSSLFFLINISYIAVIPKEEIRNSEQLVAALFFHHVYGGHWGVQLLPFFVALSCFGNIVATTVGQARVIREVARQGLLPYPELLSSTRPLGTPIGPTFIKSAMSITLVTLLPAKDAYNFILDLVAYPIYVFQCALIVGVWLLRRRRRLAGASPSLLQAKDSVIILYLLLCAFLLLMPWVPPEPGRGDVSFWYATYCVVAILILAAAAAYYWIWVVLLPYLGKYELVEVLEEFPDGAKNRRFVRRYKTHETQPLLGAPE